MVNELGVWAYAVVGGAGEERLSGLTGVGGEPVRIVKEAGLAAAVGTVGLDEFGAEPLHRNLEDLGWLEATARAHHHVIETISYAGAVVPMRLATVYRDDRRVAEVLAERCDDFRAALRRVEARQEWGVKLYATAGARTDPTADVSVAGVAGAGVAGPGAAYLLRRRGQLSAREDAQRTAVMSAEDVHAELGQLARAAKLHALQDPQLAADAGSMILNAAYLVDNERAGDFADAVEMLADRHHRVRLELTGPWPPYSFASVEEKGL